MCQLKVNLSIQVECTFKVKPALNYLNPSNIFEYYKSRKINSF